MHQDIVAKKELLLRHFRILLNVQSFRTSVRIVLDMLI